MGKSWRMSGIRVGFRDIDSGIIRPVAPGVLLTRGPTSRRPSCYYFAGTECAGVLPLREQCLTLSYMKSSALTIRLDRALERQLARLAKRSGRSRSDIARDALRRQLAILQFEDARRQIMPFAEARGY